MLRRVIDFIDYVLTISRYNDVFSCFAAKSLNREFVYNDIPIERYDFAVPFPYRKIGVPLLYRLHFSFCSFLFSDIDWNLNFSIWGEIQNEF